MAAPTVPAPALPFGPLEYERSYQDQLNSVQRLFYNRLTSSYNNLVGVNGGANLQSPHALLMSDQDQPSAGVTSENIVTYNQPIIEQGIEVRNGSEIWFDNPGQYLITFSIQFTNRENTARTIEVWAKQDGINFPLSNTRYDIDARKNVSEWSHTVAAISGIFTVIEPSNTYLRIAWWSDGPDVFLEHYAAGASPTRPAIPSVILTANFVSRLP